MADCDHDQASSPEMDAAVARAAIGERDLGHAAHHVAGALAADPLRPDLLALLAELVTAAGGVDGALALFPIEGGTWYGAAAIRARLLADSEPAAALDLLCQVGAVRPEVPYLPWAEPWVDRLAPASAATSFRRLLAVESGSGTATLEPALTILAELRRRHPEEAGLWAISSMLTRRTGRLGEAWELARAAFERFPSWDAAVALANACRAVDRWDEAQDAWRAALRFEPDDVAIRLDWADTLLDRSELDAARAKYQEALDLAPDHPWAVPSALYVDWARNPTTAGRLALQAYAERHPDNERATRLAEKITPWVGRLPPPREALLGLLRGLTGGLVAQVSHLEGPSSQVAARRVVERLGGAFSYGASHVPVPDPRIPFLPARFTLWSWSGTDASPALGPPTVPAVGEVLAKLASSWYHSERWLGHGAEIARQHGVGPSEAEQLLRAALHPPEGPSWADPCEWQYRVAHAAAFVLAGFPGWEGADPRDALRAMLAVRNDWLTVAAVAALAERGRIDPEVRTEVEPLLLGLLDDGHPWVGWSAICGLLRLGSADDELRRTLLARLPGFEDPTPDA